MSLAVASTSLRLVPPAFPQLAVARLKPISRLPEDCRKYAELASYRSHLERISEPLLAYATASASLLGIVSASTFCRHRRSTRGMASRLCSCVYCQLLLARKSCCKLCRYHRHICRHELPVLHLCSLDTASSLCCAPCIIEACRFQFGACLTAAQLATCFAYSTVGVRELCMGLICLRAEVSCRCI